MSLRNDPKYKDSPPEATFVNILGVLLVVFGAFVLWIATRTSWKRPSDQVLSSLLTSGGGGASPKVGTALSQHSNRAVDPEASGDARRRNGKSDDSGQVN